MIVPPSLLTPVHTSFPMRKLAKSTTIQIASGMRSFRLLHRRIRLIAPSLRPPLSLVWLKLGGDVVGGAVGFSSPRGNGVVEGGLCLLEGRQSSVEVTPPRVMPLCPPPGEASQGGSWGCGDQGVGFVDPPCSRAPCVQPGAPQQPSQQSSRERKTHTPCAVPKAVFNASPFSGPERQPDLDLFDVLSDIGLDISDQTLADNLGISQSQRPLTAGAFNLSLLHPSHTLMQMYGVIFCSACGSWTISRPKLLSDVCVPSRKELPSQKDVLKRIADGRPPKNKMEWPIDFLVARDPGPLGLVNVPFIARVRPRCSDSRSKRKR